MYQLRLHAPKRLGMMRESADLCWAVCSSGIAVAGVIWASGRSLVAVVAFWSMYLFSGITCKAEASRPSLSIRSTNVFHCCREERPRMAPWRRSREAH
jgi:hypothetical protein